MDDESSSIKLELYLLSFSDTEQRQYQCQLPVKEKTGRNYTYCKYTYQVWRSEKNPVTGVSSVPSSVSTWVRPRSSLIVSTTKRVTKTHCTNQGGQNRALKDAREIYRWRAPPRGAGINQDEQIKSYRGGGSDWRRSPIPPVMQIPQGGWLDQARRGDRKHPNQTNKPNWVTEHTPIKNPHSPEKSTTNPHRIRRGSYRADITPRKRLLK